MKDSSLIWSTEGIAGALQFSPSGEFLTCVHRPRPNSRWKLTFFNPLNGLKLNEIKLGLGDSRFAFFPKSNYLCYSSKDKLIIWDLTNSKEFVKFKHNKKRLSFIISPNEKYIIGGGLEFHVWDFRTGKVIYKFGFENKFKNYRTMAISPNSKFLMVPKHTTTDPYIYKIEIWDIINEKLLKQIDVGYDVYQLRFFPDGKNFISWGQHKLELRKFPSGKLVKTLLHLQFPMIFSPDLKYIIYATNAKNYPVNESIVIKNFKNDELVQTYKNPLVVNKGQVPISQQFAVSPNGNLIATSGYRGITGTRRFITGPLCVWDFSKRKVEYERKLQEKFALETSMKLLKTEQKKVLLEGFEEKLKSIKKLIQNNKFLEALEVLTSYKKKVKEYEPREILDWIDKTINICKIQIIKRTVLELCTKFARLQIIEIAEECGFENSLITSTVKQMIKNNDIHAKYFESSKSVVFDQQANIEEIDKLMSTYKDWEEEKVGKKS